MWPNAKRCARKVSGDQGGSPNKAYSPHEWTQITKPGNGLGRERHPEGDIRA